MEKVPSLVTEKNGITVSCPSAGRYVVEDFSCKVNSNKSKTNKQKVKNH